MIAIIPAAGMGTRFLPFTKSVPKELVPIMAKPAIEYILEEALQSDIHAFTLVISKEKTALKHYLTEQPELNAFLKEKNKVSSLANLHTIMNNSTISFVYQDQPLGLGHAVLCAEQNVKSVGHVTVMLPDELMFTQSGGASTMLKNMQKIALEQNASVIAVQRIPKENTGFYGIVDIVKKDNHFLEIRNVIEKPTPAVAPSNLAIIGRYVLDYAVFKALAATKAGALGEIQLTDAIGLMIKQGHKIIAYEWTDLRFDIGSPTGWLEANIFKNNTK